MMKTRVIVIAAIAAGLTIAGDRVTQAQDDQHAGHMFVAAQQSGTTPFAAALRKRADLPAAEETAKATLNTSRRHADWVDINAGTQPIETFIVYPERSDKAPVVIAISDSQGLTDWIRSVGDQLASEGFIAVVPDMLSGMGPNGGNTDSFADAQEAMKGIGQLTRDEVMRRLNAVRDYAVRLPAANGKSAIIGFCWGGGHSFSFAAEATSLNAAVVFDGTSPDAQTLAKINVPLVGFYGGNDARVNATIEPAAAAMKKLGKKYEPTILPDAGHGFVRNQSRSEADFKATEQAWPKAMAFLKQQTK
jgi:carboxymethylenebutenolidase